MFTDALDLVLQFEGGYSNDPDDPGGATNYGITQAVYDPSKQKKVRDITRPEVEKIYRNQYWREGNCDAIATVSPNLATIHFDNCVNCGVGSASRMLQSVLGVQVDGIIGKITLSKIDDTKELQKKYLDRRKLYYDRLITLKPVLGKFRKSWYHRLKVLANKCGIDYES